MTQVIFKFNNPDGTPRADAAFEVRLTVPGLVDSENSVVLPQTYEMVTDTNGEFTMELEPAVSLYKVRTVPESEDDCCGHTFSFYVPESAAPVYVQDLIMLPPPSNVPWDEEQMNMILQAGIDSNNSAIAAHNSEVAAAASADRAELAAQGVEDYADAAAASAAAALVSQNAAAGSASAADASKVAAADSATNAASSATSADASKTAAATSATNAANSATAAAGSATAADASKTAAAGSATAAAGSATTASTKAGEASASATAAAGSATTASTKAGEASASAVTAKNEADRAQGYADSINSAALAPINSPTFTGDPKAPTPASTDSDTSVATTAFVRAAMALFGIGIVTNAPALANFDDTTAGAGLYATTGTTLNPPPQVSNGAGMLLHKVSGTSGFQLFNQYGSSTFVYRSRTASAWQPWQHVGQDVLGLYGLGLSTYQPTWPNTSLDDCTAVRSGVYRTIGSTTGMPGGINNTSVVKFWLRDGAIAGTFQVVQELINASTGRRFTRTAPGTGTAGAPTWGNWREEAYLDNSTFTGTTTINTLNTGNLASSSVYSSSTIRADGDISSKTGFTATPASDGTTAGTFFTKVDFANSGYLQFAATPTGMNIVSGRTGTGAAQNLDFYTTLGVMLRMTQNGAVNFVSPTLLQGIWSNSPLASRTRLQTNVVNGNTAIPLIPNGTAQVSGIHMYGSSSDQENTSLLSVYCNAAAGASSIINTTKTGTGTTKDLILMYQDGSRITLNNQGTQFAGGTNIQGDFYSGPGSFASRTFIRSPVGQTQTHLSIGPAINAAGPQTTGVQMWSGTDLENSPRTAIYAASDGSSNIWADRTGTGTYGPLILGAGGSARLRIDANGNLVAGSANSDDPIGLGSVGMRHLFDGFMDIRSNTYRCYGAAVSNTFSAFHQFFYGGASPANVGSITTNGTATAFNTTSDYRVKDNVRDLPDCRAYIMATRPVLHTWTTGYADNSLPTAGFIAHELQEVFPQIVTGEKDAVDAEGNIILQGVDYGKLTPYLTAATKSLIEENEVQAEQIATLQEENRVLKLQMAAVLEHLNLTVDTTVSETPEGEVNDPEAGV